MQRRHPLKKPFLNAQKSQINKVVSVAPPQQHRSNSPSDADNNNENSQKSEMLEDASLRAAISLFANTMNGIPKSRRKPSAGADTKKVRFGGEDKDGKLSPGASASDPREHASPQTNIERLVNKLVRNTGLTLAEIQAITSYLQSPLMAITGGEQGDQTAQIGSNSIEMTDDFIAFAFVSTLNAHLRFSNSTNVSECTSLTRLTAALLDTVTNCLDHFSTRLEQSEVEQQQGTKPVAINLGLYSRVIATFASSQIIQNEDESAGADEEEQKMEQLERSKSQPSMKLKGELQAYEQGPDLVSELINSERILKNNKVEQFLTDSLNQQIAAAQEDALAAAVFTSADQVMIDTTQNEKNVAVASEEPNFDDLDAVLNQESKEFTELVSSMNKALTIKKAAAELQGEKSDQQKHLSQQSSKDLRQNQQFLQRSITRVKESIERYIQALLSTGKGLNCAATVGQLHRLTAMTEGAVEVGTLLQGYKQINIVSQSNSESDELTQNIKTTIVEQIDLNFMTLQALKEQADTNSQADEMGAAMNKIQKINAVTEAEIAFVRLGGLAMALSSLHEVQPIIEKASDLNLAQIVVKMLSICPNDRLESFEKAVCSVLHPLLKVISLASADNKESQNSILSLVLSLTQSLQELSAKNQARAQSSKPPSVVTRSQAAQAQASASQPTSVKPAKGREDFRKFLRAKRMSQATAKANSSADGSNSILADFEMALEQPRQAKPYFELDEEEKKSDVEATEQQEKEAAADQNMKEEAPSSFEEPVAERLIIVAAPDFETSIQASEMLLIYISKQLTNETEQISVDSLQKVFSLIKKVKESRKTIYEGILMLFCKAKLNDLPELKAAIEGQISSMKVEEIASSRVLTTLVCKLLLKLAFGADTMKELYSALLKHVFEKGFLKKAAGGPLFQGMQLNIYMLILTCLCTPNSREWRTEICKGQLLGQLKTALNSESAQKNIILTYLQQIWHLIALMMLDENAQKLQKKAIIAFLTKSEASTTIEMLLANPINWRLNQTPGQLSVLFTTEELYAFIQDIYKIRNVFQASGVEETLDIPCSIIGAQISQLGEASCVSLPDGADTETHNISVLVKNTLDFHKLVLGERNSLVKEELETSMAMTHQRLSEALTNAIQVIIKGSDQMPDKELELLKRCLSGDVSKPLLDLTTIENSPVAQALKVVLQRDDLPFPLVGVSSAPQLTEGVCMTVSGLHVYQHLFNQIRGHAQTGAANMSMDDLFLTQKYYSLQTIYFAQRKIMANQFQVKDSIEEARSKVIRYYVSILELCVDLLQVWTEATGNEQKITEIKKNVIGKIASSDHFSQHQFSQYMSKLMLNSTEMHEELIKILSVALSAHLIQVKSADNNQPQRESLRSVRAGLQLSFEFGSRQEPKEEQKIDTSEIQTSVTAKKENPIFKRILLSITTAFAQQPADGKRKCAAALWDVLSSQSDNLANHFIEALHWSEMTSQFGKFLEVCFKDQQQAEPLSECIYEAIETACGLKTSVSGYLNTDFVLNCMSLANMVKNLVQPAQVSDQKPSQKPDNRFIQFIKEVLMQQAFENEDARLLVLDTLCMLCQDLASQSSGDSAPKDGSQGYEAMVVYCRKQYLDFKKSVEDRRLQAEQDIQEEMERQESKHNSSILSIGQLNTTDKNDKKRKQALLEGYKEEVFDNSQTDYAKYMFRPENSCTYLRTQKKYEEQHWYYCYTCGLTGNTGACSVCVRVCHKGHHVIYCRKSTFFCDCQDSGGNCSFSSQIAALQNPNNGQPAGGLFNIPPSSGFPPQEAMPPGASNNPFILDSFNEVHPSAFGSMRPPPESLISSLPFEGGSPRGDGGLFAGVRAHRPPGHIGGARPSSRLDRAAERASIPSFGHQQRQNRQELGEPYMPSFAAFGSRPPGGGPRGDRDQHAAERGPGGLFGPSLSSLFGAGPPSQRQRKMEAFVPQRDRDRDPRDRAGDSMRPSFANMMRRFDRIVNEESDNSHANGDPHEAHQRENAELSRIIERSLGRGSGALFSDANFFGGPINRISAALDRPVYEEPASDSGLDDMEVIDESNLAAFQQELQDAGYSASEIRASIQSRLDRQGGGKVVVEDGENEQSSSNSDERSQRSDAGLRRAAPNTLSQPDFEMSDVSSRTDGTWGGISDAESLHSAHFRNKLPIQSLERQSQRFAALKTVLKDQQEIVEGILSQVFDHLDNFDRSKDDGYGQGLAGQESMEVDQSLGLVKRMSSAGGGSQILVATTAGGSKTKSIDFKSDLVQQKHQHKESTFKALVSDRVTKTYISENMGRRRCVSSTDQGLVCVLEDDTVFFYAANTLLDSNILQGAAEKNQLYSKSQQPKRGGSALGHVDTFKPQFVPVSVQFNPSYESYCAIWGMSDLQVVTVCPKEGKVKSELTVNLMLAAFGEHLSILNVQWVPAARTTLGVGTSIFVRIYDLSKDNFSPLFNVQLPQGSISDFTFTKPLDANYTETGRIQSCILVASNTNAGEQGQLYFQELTLSNEERGELSKSGGDNFMQVDDSLQSNEIFLTQDICIPEHATSAAMQGEAARKITKASGQVPGIESVSYLPTHSMIVLTFTTGASLIGKLDMRTLELSNCLALPAMASLKKSSAQQLLNNGDSFSDFHEVPHLMLERSQSIYLTAKFSKSGCAVPCILEITPDKVNIEVVRPKNANLSSPLTAVHGFALVKPSFRKTWRKSPRLVTIEESGTATVYKLDLKQPDADERAQFLNELNSQRKIARADLPKRVTMPATFFEKQKSIWSDQPIYKQMGVTGSFATLLKSKIHRIFDPKYEHQSNYADDRDSETKLNLNLNTRKSENVIVGVRLRIGASKGGAKVSFRLFDREPITVAQGDSFWYDVALSDVEVIYGSQNQVELTFNTSNVKSCPVRIIRLEVYIATVSEFQLAEKMGRHLKEIYKQHEAKRQTKTVPTSAAAIRRELLQTNHLPYVGWQEKYRAGAANVNQLETKLSILQQFLLSNIPVQADEQLSPDLRDTLLKLKTKLLGAYKIIVQQAVRAGAPLKHDDPRSAPENKPILVEADLGDTNASSEAFLHASVKRTLKIVLFMLKRDSMLGDPLNFSTVKDRLTFDTIRDQYNNASEVSIDEVRGHLQALGAIRAKRSPQYFKLIEADESDLVSKITQAYLSATQSEKHSLQSRSEIQRETSDLVNLIFADYQLHVNRNYQIKESLKTKSLKKVIEEVFVETSLAERLEPIARLLLTKNDRTAKQTIKSIQRCLFQYQTMMARSFKSDQIVRFKYFNEATEQLEDNEVILVDIIPHLLHQLLTQTIPKHRERAQLAYKVSLGILGAYGWQSTSLGLPCSFVFPPVKHFLQRVLCETQMSEHSYQFVYASLALLNVILISPQQQSFLQSGGVSFDTATVPSALAKKKPQQEITQPQRQAPSLLNGGDNGVAQLSPLRAQQRTQLMAYLSKDQKGRELTEKLLTWISSALEQLNATYQAGRCSLRVQLENQVKVGAQDYLGAGQLGSSVNLLRPVVNQTASWRWTPLLPDSDEIFELLDRKIPASILMLCQILAADMPLSEQTAPYKKLLRAIAQLSHTLPSSHLYSRLGQNVLMTLAPGQAKTLKNQTLLKEFLSDLKQICLVQLKMNISEAQKVGADADSKVISTQQASATDYQSKKNSIGQQRQEMGYNMQFQFQKMLQNGTKLAFETPNDWRELIDSTGSRSEIIRLLIRLLDYVGDKSAYLCLVLAALTLEKSGKVADKHSVAKSVVKLGAQGSDGQSLFRMIQAILDDEEKENMKEESKETVQAQQATYCITLDIRKLVDVYLLGKSSRMIRIATAQLLKGMYDSGTMAIGELLSIFMSKFTTLSATGVNSSEFLSLFGYICQRELTSSANVTDRISPEQVVQIVTFISTQIKSCNRELTSHPNLDLYATVQKVCSQGGAAGPKIASLQPGLHPSHAVFGGGLSAHGDPISQLEGVRSLAGPNLLRDASQATGGQQQYILELDPCSKCFQTMSTPYRSANLKDLTSEQKYTDATSIYRLKHACQLKSISFNVHEAKGYKTVTKVTFYVNSIQQDAMDLAEMKTNFSLWQKVCDLPIDVSTKQSFTATLPLPVTATNILIEFHSVNLAKPVEFNSRKASKYYNAPPGYGLSGIHEQRQKDLDGGSGKQVEGLDGVLSLLPKEMSSKLTLESVRAQASQGENPADAVKSNISMTCPRCGSHVNNSHGNCNNCGENAMQCPACRNINYEKIDPYQCKECGISRYCKGDISLTYREGVAIQPIDSEDMKKNAEGQVGSNLQKAQQSYQVLMKQRQLIQTLACQINEGSENASPKHLQAAYSGECLTQYTAMMKSLSVIKQLRIEISKFQKTASASSQIDLSVHKPDDGAKPSADTSATSFQQSCFGCIHEYLQALLNFIVLTARSSRQIRETFAQKQQAKQLYNESLRMFSQSIQRPARLAICALIKDDQAQSTALLQQIEHDLHTRRSQVPSHLLLQNLHQEAQLLIDLYSINREEVNSDRKDAIATFWRVLFQSLKDAQASSAVAEAVTAPILLKIEHVISTELRESERKQQELKKQEMEVDQVAEPQPLVLIRTEAEATQGSGIKGESAMLQLLIDYFQAESQTSFAFVPGDPSTCSEDGQWLVQSLLLNSSQSARKQAMAIFRRLLSESQLRPKITEMLLEYLDASLENSPLASEEYFNLLTLLLTDDTSLQPKEAVAAGGPPKELQLGKVGQLFANLGGARDAPFAAPHPKSDAKEKQADAKKKQQARPAEITEDTKRYFRKVFDRIDGELVKLFALEQEKKALGLDGFMPQLSAGQSLCRLVRIVALMMNDQPALTEIVQENVRVVLKTQLRLKKLTLVKNTQIKNCEEQINGIFDKLHSDNQADKSNFIKECLSLIETGDCDLQEARYLFEDICKMIAPAKPELEYFLHLQKARSNEEFIPGKMSKNPYSSKSFGGKTMGDVRLKICRDCDIGEPEMLELLVAGKIVTMNLPITAVYEQVWWPAQYKQKHPDSYEVPPIEQGMKEDPSLINSMVVIFRLAGMDGEATEDRVESLQTNQEPSSEKELEKKYGLASVIGDKLNAGQPASGVSVLLKTLESIGHVQDDKDLASWLVQLMNITIKLRKNRTEFLRHSKAVAIIAKKLFQSVGMHSKFDGKNEQSLFDLILNILEVLINEQINTATSKADAAQVEDDQSQHMQIDTGMKEEAQQEQSEAVTHVQIFLSLISDACKEMIDQMKPLDQASKKIKAVSKVLPQLINQDDSEALSILIQLVQEHLTIEKVHLSLPSSQNAISEDTFTSMFYIERIVDIIESIPVHKNFIKDSITEIPQFNDMLQFMVNESAQFREPEVDRPEDINQNTLMLHITKAMITNHPKSQQMLARCTLVEKLYTLSLQKFKPMKLVLLAEDCVKLLTNELADGEVRSSLQQIIDKKKREQTQRAKKAKNLAKMRLQKKGAANNFLKQLQKMEEEKGPKCVTCEDGYTAKQGEILGVYVFSKKLPFREWTGGHGAGLGSQSQGYTTVTHSNFIHYQCHLEAARIEREKQPPIREWDGAKTRNHMTLCNNLFPVFGGSIQQSAYSGVVDKYFSTQSKQVGGADSNRVRILSHDLKSLLKRFACNQSFSRDSKGGGPEHNMQLVPFMVALITQSLQTGANAQQHLLSAAGSSAAQVDREQLTYVQEKRLAEFLELSTRQREAFLTRLAEEEGEEEKQPDDSEEEDKRMEEDEDGEAESVEKSQSESDDSQPIHAASSMLFGGGAAGDKPMEEDARVDQVFFFMSQALVFGRMAAWHKLKLNLITCALNVAAATAAESSGPSSQSRLRMMEEADANEEPAQGRSRARSLSNMSAALLENLPEVLGRLRPFFIMLCLVDLIKTTWDGRVADEPSQSTQEHHDLLFREYLAKGNLMEVIEDTNIFFKAYNERFTKVESVETFLSTLGLRESISADFLTIEKFIVSHF